MYEVGYVCGSRLEGTLVIQVSSFMLYSPSQYTLGRVRYYCGQESQGFLFPAGIACSVGDVFSTTNQEVLYNELDRICKPARGTLHWDKFPFAFIVSIRAKIGPCNLSPMICSSKEMESAHIKHTLSPAFTTCHSQKLRRSKYLAMQSLQKRFFSCKPKLRVHL